MTKESKLIVVGEQKREQDGEDKISHLPDPILSHILSFLPTKYSVATCILSSRWKFLWTSLSYLCFHDQLCIRPPLNNKHTVAHSHSFEIFIERLSLPVLDPNASTGTSTSFALTNNPSLRFENFVNRVLVHLTNSITLDLFSLHCLKLTDLSLLKFWVTAAILRNVREVEIYLESHSMHNLHFIESYDHVGLPESIYTSTTLEVLLLYSDLVFNIPPSGGICFPCLKILHVELLNPPRNLTEKLFSVCPVLEELSIMGHLSDAAEQVISFDISTPTLKKLATRVDIGDRLSYYDEHKIVIRAPNLELLHVRDYALVSYMVQELQSLSEVLIDVFYVDGPLDQAKRVLKLLEGVCKTKFLSLSAETMYALEWIYEDHFPTFPNLTYLEVEIRGTTWQLLLAILNSTPNLEVLVIQNYKVHGFESVFEESVSFCLLFHVKKIEMRNFEGYVHQFTLVKYFLKNSVVLEKMIVKSLEMTSQHEKLKHCQELLMFERASKTCQVEFL